MAFMEGKKPIHTLLIISQIGPSIANTKDNNPLDEEKEETTLLPVATQILLVFKIAPASENRYFRASLSVCNSVPMIQRCPSEIPFGKEKTLRVPPNHKGSLLVSVEQEAEISTESERGLKIRDAVTFDVYINIRLPPFL